MSQPENGLTPDVIRDQAAFLRQVLPSKYHDFFDKLCRTALRSPDLDAGAVNEVDVINPHVMDLVRAHGSTMTNSEIVQKFLPLQRPSACDLDAVIEATIRACARVCEDKGSDYWKDYKTGDGPKRADPHYQGMSDGAHACSEAIRALDRSKINAAPQENRAVTDRGAKNTADTYPEPAGAAPDVREFRKASLSEALEVMRARLSEHLSPAEKRELEQAAALLAQPAAAEKEKS